MDLSTHLRGPRPGGAAVLADAGADPEGQAGDGRGWITSIEQEFLADMVLPGDVAVSEALLPRLDEAMSTGLMPDLLPGGGAIPLQPAR